jgi:hypothetical protein
MKFLKTSFLAITMMAGSIGTFAQTAEEIIEKHIQAIGGADNWKKINTYTMKGSVNAGGMEIPVSITTSNGKGMRMEYDLMGMSNYMIITPTEGWMYFPAQGQTKPEPFTADQIKEMQDQLDVQGELVDYAKKGGKVEFLGKDDMEGTETYKVKFYSNTGKEKTLFFDVANYYLLRETEKVKADGKEMESTVNYSNFKKLPEGVTMPMTVESQMGPVTMSEIVINPKVDESIFKPAN